MRMRVNRKVVGRVELVVGRLGQGKTTFAAERVRALGARSGRPIATTGKGWGDEWMAVNDFDAMEKIGIHAFKEETDQFGNPIPVGAVLLLDEAHLWVPSVRGAVKKEYEMALLKKFSLLRKHRVCVVGTTQAYTRVGTHYRQLVTTVWWPRSVVPGVYHTVLQTTPPEDGQEKIGFRRSYDPRRANIPTNAEVWLPPSLWGEDEDEAEKVARPARRPRPVSTGSSWGIG